MRCSRSRIKPWRWIQGRTAAALALVFSVLAVGSAGYVIIEGFPPFDAVYMTVITVTTVGFAEIRPLSTAGRVFTVCVILMGFGALAFAGRSIAESLVEKVMNRNAERIRMRKRIAGMRNHAIVCGYGRVGAAATSHLVENDVPVCVIESDPNQIEALRAADISFVQGDATDEEVLLQANIKNASALLALLRGDAENLFLTLTARELNPTLYIIARAEQPANREKTLRAGADEVILPHAMAGRKMAETFLAQAARPTSCLCEPSEAQSGITRWLPVMRDSELAGKTVREAANALGRQIIGLRRKRRDTLFPPGDTVLRPGDLVLTLENRADKKPEEPQRLPVVLLVEDNPAVLKLYTRLFKRKGFLPVGAKTAAEALRAVQTAIPSVAVIDHILPDLPGTELCKELRRRPELRSLKVVLFTARDTPEVRAEAQRAGVDRVVIKSAEAGHIINTVLELIDARKQVEKEPARVE